MGIPFRLLDFLSLHVYLCRNGLKMNTTKEYKRKSREVPQQVRDKISASLAGRKKTPEHCANISKGLRADTGGYWSHISKVSGDNTTVEDLL